MNYFSLEGLDLVDAEPEPSFTHLAELASRLIDAPVSLITFIQEEKDRQFFKAHIGLNISETPLSGSFCKIVVDNDACLVVNNSTDYPGVEENPVVNDFVVHSYLGTPVHDPYGNPIASLCVIDNKPRDWSAADESNLEKLAQCVTDAIRLKFALNESERQGREQRDFAHAISHDFRTPLHTLGWTLELVEELHGQDFAEETRLLVEAGQNTVKRTCQMVDELLELMHLNTKQSLELKAVDLSALLDDIKVSIHADIARRQASIQVDEKLPTVTGSRCQLDMLFRNLLSNAIKFNRTGIAPCVHVSGRWLNNAAEISIADNGIGVSEDIRDRIFSPFERGDRSAGYEGSGIGLSLVHRVAENHGGHVRIESDGKTGSTFIVHLPQQQVAHQADDINTLSKAG